MRTAMVSTATTTTPRSIVVASGKKFVHGKRQTYCQKKSIHSYCMYKICAIELLLLELMVVLLLLLLLSPPPPPVAGFRFSFFPFVLLFVSVHKSKTVLFSHKGSPGSLFAICWHYYFGSAWCIHVISFFFSLVHFHSVCSSSKLRTLAFSLCYATRSNCFEANFPCILCGKC